MNSHLGEVMEEKFIRSCSIWRALEVVGDYPTLLILEVSWLGGKRFDGIRRRTGLLKASLSSRLRRLVEAGLMEKRRYCDSPPRYEYIMTEKGQGLYWVALMLLRWERRWQEPGKISVELTHKTCGKVFDPVPACGACNVEIDPKEVEWSEGPGVSQMKALYSRRRRSRDAEQKSNSLMDQAAQIMGDRWSSLILRSIYTGINRFDEILADTAIATNILSERLAWLEEIGMIRPKQYHSNPPRYEYRLRSKGVDYYHALLMLQKWGDTYYCAPEGPPLLLTHKLCDSSLDPKVICSECQEPIDVRAVTYKIVGEIDVTSTAGVVDATQAPAA
ncbi:transcriptional regulator [Algimonas ampicilliniresistens]|uniref:Transcriptional regulator n=1 Tax=Algimonas ampicilliniresistens TaxID=1298735 RepID=A0ABQ5VEY1_9PROT|nr:helix-turn-helix domain-containing protein [Algimonas ampicilliniresistens]GLQ25146.1 transcriptional regulator [Algimonas ampicilliniresistens]